MEHIYYLLGSLFGFGILLYLICLNEHRISKLRGRGPVALNADGDPAMNADLHKRYAGLVEKYGENSPQAMACGRRLNRCGGRKGSDGDKIAAESVTRTAESA